MTSVEIIVPSLISGQNTMLAFTEINLAPYALWVVHRVPSFAVRHGGS